MVEHLINGVIFILDKLGYFGTFAGMALESACIPIPSEAILPFGGYLSFTGRLNLVWMIIMGTLGGTVGSIGAYYLGRFGGRPLVEKYADKLKLSKSHLEKSDEYFNKYGEKIVFYSRLLPIIRTFISLPAGISKMDFKKFTIYTFLGSLIWSVVLGYAGYKMGENWTAMRAWFHVADIAFVVFVVGFIIYKLLGKKAQNANT